MALRKTDKADLRKRYPIYVEVGLIVALVLLIAAFRIDFSPDAEMEFEVQEQEIVQMEEIQQTKQIEQPPPPPRPPVPVEVPNDEILEDDDLDLDASLDIDEPLADLPPPPPPEEDEEEPEPEVFVVVENMPELIGGLGAIQKDIKYPEIARKAGVEGRVIVQGKDVAADHLQAEVGTRHPLAQALRSPAVAETAGLHYVQAAARGTSARGGCVRSHPARR